MELRNLIPFGRKTLAVKREEEHPFVTMQQEMNRIFDSFNRTWNLDSIPEGYGSYLPRIDVASDDKTFTVTAEMPGMSSKDIDLSIAGDLLFIRGEKKEEHEDRNPGAYYSERIYGSFSRSIPLPGQVETDKVSATFDKGVLKITMPKTATPREATKRIRVTSA